MHQVKCSERDLLEHLKSAYSQNALVYCKNPIEVNEEGRVTNNPLKNLVNINELQQKAEIDKLGQIQREARQANIKTKNRKVLITRGEKCELQFDS